MANDSSTTSSVSGSGRGMFWREAAVLLLFWLFMSGQFDPVHIGFGLLAVGIVMALDRRLPGTAREKAEQSLLGHFHRFPFYVPWLSVQMVIATWQVARVVLSRRMDINPCLVEFKSAQPHSVARVTLGNSITLTPGTLTLEIAGDRYRVHALTEANAAELLDGEIPRHVSRLFGATGERAVYDGRKIREFGDL